MRPELESRHVGIGHFPAQQVEQQRRDQRAVHHEAGIAFDFGDIAAIVVNAVAIECQRRIAEEQHGVGLILRSHDATSGGAG